MSVCYIARNTKDVTVKVLLNCALFPSRIALRKHVRQNLRWFCKKKHQQTWKREDLSNTIQNIFKKADTITPLSSYRFSIFTPLSSYRFSILPNFSVPWNYLTKTFGWEKRGTILHCFISSFWDEVLNFSLSHLGGIKIRWC